MDIFFSCGGGRGGVITKSDCFWGEGVISIHFMAFFRSRYRMGIFFGPQIFKCFLICLIFLILLDFVFGGGGGGEGGGGVGGKH